MRYDLIVIGNSPSGRKGALTAATLGKRVAIIEQPLQQVDGSCAHNGTITSKALREAILMLTGFRHRAKYPELYARRHRLTMDELRLLADEVVRQQADLVQQQLQHHGIDLISGQASFVADDEVEITGGSHDDQYLRGDRFLIATGTRPSRPEWVPFDGQTVFDSDELPDIERLPKSMIVIGGGVVGLEYALMFAVLGVKVAVVDARPRLLEFCDGEIVDQVMRQARALGITFRLGERVVEVTKLSPDRVVVTFDQGKRLMGESLLYAAGRQGNTESLNLVAAGVRPDENGRLWCNESHQTWAGHIYGVGDVVGFPSLAGVSPEQERRAVCHAFGQKFLPSQQLPYGLFTIPEVAMIGPTEEQLSADKVPYEVGVARYADVARGHLVGDPDGLLKLLFHRDTHQLVAVHVVGELANELIHIGQTVISFGGTIEYFRDAVFNDPSLAECYKVAALDGLTNLERLAPESLALVASDNESVFDDDEVSEDDAVYISHSAAFLLKRAR